MRDYFCTVKTLQECASLRKTEKKAFKELSPILLRRVITGEPTMSKDVRQAIKKLDDQEARPLLLELATLRPANAEWLLARIQGEQSKEEVLQTYKKKIKGVLQPHYNERIDLRAARQVITDFEKITKDTEARIDLMLHYVETGIIIENEYGNLYEAFYSSMESMFGKVIHLLNQYPPYMRKFRPRLLNVLATCAEGWGHREELTAIYEELEQ
jgi:hypothetical protein